MEPEPMQVAVRIRPMVQSESNSGCRSCLVKVSNTPQIIVGNSKNNSFTYNFVFDEYDGQADVYNKSVEPLISKLFEGYNVTVLAYGQTGSGKTYTMGTNYSGSGEMGIIQRAILDIFEKIHDKRDDTTFEVAVSFIELYNETLYDLLTDCGREQSVVELRESGNVIHIPGLTKHSVNSADDTLKVLQRGSNLRVTGETAMNATSSRSHAVFSVDIKIIKSKDQKGFTNSRFHLVDLAGSERAKKTKATGDRFKEGVNINKGLLTLGNVISQLGEGTGSYVNYRDSLLTRLLRDSLGGNSFTLMIACVSPADTNQGETLSTLRYADRVRKIKNKPTVNMDPQTGLITDLKKEIEMLRLQIISGGGGDCPPSHNLLDQKLRAELKKSKELKSTLKDVIFNNSTLSERNIILENMIDTIMSKISDLENQINEAKSSSGDSINSAFDGFQKVISEIKNEKHMTEKKIIDSDRADDFDPLSDDQPSDTADDMEELFIRSQTENNKKIELISKSLFAKQELIDKITANSELQNLNNSNEEVEKLKEFIEKILLEKEELVKKYQRESKMSGASKFHEEHKKKLQDVEMELSLAQKKLAQQENIVKLKAKSDEQIVKLKKEIQSLKSMKIKLVRDMKQENARFKNWLNEKNREVIKLKNLTNRQSSKINKMEEEFTLRQAVWRRKLEAAATARKRMEDAMDRQRKTHKKATDSVKISEYIEAEVEFLESTLCAKRSFKRLLDVRTTLSQELTDISKQLETSLPDSKKACLIERQTVLKEDLELHNAQIADLQQRIIDLQDGAKKQSWDNIKSVEEAKIALSCMLSAISRMKKESLVNVDAISELQAAIDVKNSALEQLQKVVKLMEAEQEHITDDITKYYEDKIYSLHASSHLNKSKIGSTALQDANSEPPNKVTNLPQKRKVTSFCQAYLEFIESQKSSDDYSDKANSEIKDNRSSELNHFDMNEWKKELLVRTKKRKTSFFSEEDIKSIGSNKENMNDLESDTEETDAFNTTFIVNTKNG